jgi:hypothetical protein
LLFNTPLRSLTLVVSFAMGLRPTHGMKAHCQGLLIPSGLPRDFRRKGVRFIEQGREPDPRARKKRAQMLARALRKLGYEVRSHPYTQLLP